MKKRYKKVEDGEASLLVKLRDGNITVYHGSDHKLILMQCLSAPPGTWDKMWDGLKKLGFKPYIDDIIGK